jgi:hypothetical protein
MSKAGDLKTSVKLFRPFMKSPMVLQVRTAKNAPPKVMIMEGASTKDDNPPTPEPDITPNKNIPKQRPNPNTEARSTSVT